jgi:hypothetical protein
VHAVGCPGRGRRGSPPARDGTEPSHCTGRQTR